MAIAGEIGYGVEQAPRMEAIIPVVTPSRSSELLSIIGKTVQTGAKIVGQEKAIEAKKMATEEGKAQAKLNKRIKAQNQIDGEIEGNKKYQELAQEAIDKGLIGSEKAKFLRDGLSLYADKLKAKGDDVNIDFMSSAFKTMAGYLDNDIASSMKHQQKLANEGSINNASTSVQASFFSGNLNTIDSVTKVFNAGGFETRGDAAKFVAENIASIILEKSQREPNYSPDADIQRYLKIKGTDGVDYASHKVYGKIIDGLEQSLDTLANSRATEMTDIAKRQAKTTTNNLLLTLNKQDVSPSDLSKIRMSLPSLSKSLSVTQFSSVLSALEDSEDVDGYSLSSNPEIFNRLKQEADNGRLNYNGLKAHKQSLTKEEFKTLGSAIMTFGNIIETGDNKIRQEAYQDAEANGIDLVAPSGINGFLYPEIGAKSAFRFKREFNTWKADYYKNNQELPSSEESFAKAESIANSILKTQNKAAKSSNVIVVEQAIKDGVLQQRINQGVINQDMVNEYNTYSSRKGN